MVVVQERLESGAGFVAAHSLARAGGLVQVHLCEEQWGITARLGRLSSAAVRHGRLSSAAARNMRLSSARLRHGRLSNGAWWTDIGGLIGSTVLMVMQAHDRTVCATELEEVPAVAIRVGVVRVALGLDDAKENLDDALADYALSET